MITLLHFVKNHLILGIFCGKYKMKTFLCQSCGMSIHNEKIFGTGKNGSRIEDYCIYCYKDGHFTQNVTMDEMINLCARYVEGNSHDVAIVSMKLLYPHLKRWARKEQTQHEYYRSINRVLEYIQDHLNENTDLKTLAGIANISPYHFHRIFKTTIGESLADYVQRLRLEYVAEQLKICGLSLSELADKTGYSSAQSLSRAFKKYFNIPPSVFRASFFKEKFKDELVPRICKVSEKNIIMLYKQEENENNWQKLYMYALVNRLLSESTESLDIIKDSKYHHCLNTNQLIPSNKHVLSITLSEGLYAIFTHKGSLKKITGLFEAVINYWLPSSKYTLVPTAPTYIKYLSNMLSVTEENYITEIYLPVMKISKQ